jgi:Fe-S cluster assembly iron-binding protein IscA
VTFDKDFKFNGTLDFVGFEIPINGLFFNGLEINKGSLKFSGERFEGHITFSNCVFEDSGIVIESDNLSKGMFTFMNNIVRNGNFVFSVKNMESRHLGIKGNNFFKSNLIFDIGCGKSSEVIIDRKNRFESTNLIFSYRKVNLRKLSISNNFINNSKINFKESQINGEFNFCENKLNGSNLDLSGAKINHKGIYFKENKFINTYIELGSENKKREIDYIDFSDCHFAGSFIDFKENDFGELSVLFNRIKVDGIFNFSNTGNQAKRFLFEASEFNGPVDFSNLKNSEDISEISFQKSAFEKSLDISNNKFNFVVDLRSTSLKHQLSLHGLNCDYRKNKKGEPSDANDEPKLKRLKEIAESNKDHFLAMECYADEMRVKRKFSKSKIFEISDYCYDKLTNYGRSIKRPLSALVLVWLFFGGLYYWVSDVKTYENYNLEKLIEALTLSGGHLLPFINSARLTRKEGVEVLFGSDLSPLMNFLTITQSLISFGLVFLIGLALRNRFKI